MMDFTYKNRYNLEQFTPKDGGTVEWRVIDMEMDNLIVVKSCGTSIGNAYRAWSALELSNFARTIG